MEKKARILDYIFLTLIVSIVTLQPYFMHGAINFYETGLYFPQINEVFAGKVLYKDMFVPRGPLEILIPAFLMRLFGIHTGILSAYFYFGTVLTLIIYAIFALKVFNTRGFAYLFTLALLARTFPRVTFALWGGIRFGLGILALLLAIIFLKRKKALWLFLSGIVSSLALWTSIEMGVFSFISIFIMLCLYGCLEFKDPKAILRYVSIYVFGNIVISAPFVFYLVSQNAISDYIDIIRVVLFNTAKVFNPAFFYDTPANLKEFVLAFLPWSHNFKYTLPFFFYVSVGIYLFRHIIKKRFSIADISIVPLCIYGVFLYKGAFRNIEGPHYRIALQPLLLIMFFYLERIYAYLRNVKLSGLKKILAMLFVVIIPLYSIAFSVYKYNKRFFIFKEINSLIVQKKHLDIPYTDPNPAAITSERAKGIVVPGAQAEEIDAVVDYISLNTREDEAIFTFPDLGAYNFLADRPPLGRFYSAEMSFLHPRWFGEVMTELKTKKPRFVICAKEFPRPERFRLTVGQYLDEVKSFLDNNYVIERSYRAVNILKIKQ